MNDIWIADDAYNDGRVAALEEAAVICEEMAVGSKLLQSERYLLMRAAELIRARLPSHNG